jgi:single-strand DNA-binding protein
MNQCQLMGRLTADPELKTTPQGTLVCAFTLAVDRRFDKEKADFIRIVAWRSTAEFCSKYFHKGQKIAVVGSIQTRRYEDKEGKKRSAVEVVAESVYFAESKSTAEQMSFAESTPETVLPPEDDLPF